MRRFLPIALLFLAVAVRPATATTPVPSPTFSSVDPCLVQCPGTDIGFNVVVRDMQNMPMPNSVVTLDFSACPMFDHCFGAPPNTFNDAARTAMMVTNSSGVAAFYLPMGGICPGSAVRIYADGVALATRSFASPDHNGDLFPDNADRAAIQALVGTNDPTADFDCNGIVDAADLAIFDQHRYHACPLVEPVKPRSWGSLKLLYR